MNYLLICDIIFYHLIPYIVCKQYKMCGCVSLCESPGGDQINELSLKACKN